MSGEPTLERFHVLRTPLDEGITLLEASAGTGKTWSLTTLAVRLLIEERVRSLDRVLLVTFTEAATAELKDRLRKRLAEAHSVLRGGSTDDEVLRELCSDARPGAVRDLELALNEFDEVRVQTLHGFCAQLLAESAFELVQPFGEEGRGAGATLARQALRDAWRDGVHGRPDWFGSLVARCGLYPAKYRPALETRLRHPHAELRPKADDLESFLRWGQRQREALTEHWDTEPLVRRLRDTPAWVKDGRELGCPDYLIDRLLESEGHPGGELLPLLTPAGLKKLAGSKGMKNPGGWNDFFDQHPLGRALAGWGEIEGRLPDVLRNHLLESAVERYRQIKDRAELLDFDDLIERVHQQLRHPVSGPALRRRVRERLDVALIDEFQDTDQRQWEIFHTLFDDARLILVGDPKQAIYGFRGADVFAYLRASRRAARRTTLTRNWRSHPALVSAVGHLFGRQEGAFVFEAIGLPPVEGAVDPEKAALRGDHRPPLLVEVIGEEESQNVDETGRAAIDRAVAEMLRLLSARPRLSRADGREERPVGPGDVAVLVRTRRQGRDVVDALREAGVPAVLSAMGDIYESTEMEELAVVLEAILHPRHRGRRQRAVATLLWGKDLVGVRAPLDDEEVETALVEELESHRARWRDEGLVATIGELFRRRSLRSRMLALTDGERRFTNYQHAAEILDRDAGERDLRGEALLRWIRRARGDEEEAEERQLRLEKDAEAVQVVTMHSSKGLQYEVVFCPFLWNTHEQLKKGKAQLVHVEEGEDRREVLDFEGARGSLAARALAESLAENMRLAYVAVTRARRRCVMTVARPGRSAGKTATDFLLHRPPRERGESDEDWVKRSQQAAQPALDGVVEALCAEAPDRIGRVGAAGLEVQPPLEERDEERLEARPFPSDRRLRRWIHTSFTHMTRGAPMVDVADHFDPADAELAPTVADDGIRAFARGARAGICLHELLEEIDFAGSLAGAGPRVERILERHGLDRPAAHAAAIEPLPVVLDLLERVRAEPFGQEGFALGDLGPEARVHEWEFEARLGGDGTTSARDLADCFERHAAGDWKTALVRRLEHLPFDRWRGLLRGFVDLVFEHDGRWWVVDWKSNHLGSRLEDYDPASVQGSMIAHHYLLQYHLYLVALHRHLRVRLSGYDPARHLGGAGYVYLRGLRGDGVSGWFVDRPPVALVESLDRVLDGGDA